MCGRQAKMREVIVIDSTKVVGTLFFSFSTLAQFYMTKVDFTLV